MKFYKLATAAALLAASADGARVRSLHRHEVAEMEQMQAEMEALDQELENAENFFGDMFRRIHNGVHGLFKHFGMH